MFWKGQNSPTFKQEKPPKNQTKTLTLSLLVKDGAWMARMEFDDSVSVGQDILTHGFFENLSVDTLLTSTALHNFSIILLVNWLWEFLSKFQWSSVDLHEFGAIELLMPSQDSVHNESKFLDMYVKIAVSSSKFLVKILAPHET